MVCELGNMLFNTETLPCPGLIFKDNKYWCGPVIDKIYHLLPVHARLYRIALGIGKRCSNEAKEERETICL